MLLKNVYGVDNMEKTCICIGHEPEKLGDTNRCDKIKERIKEAVLNQINSGVSFFYADMARGVGLWAAQIILSLKERPEYAHLYLTALLAYPNQLDRLLEKDRLEFEKVLNKCDDKKILNAEKRKTSYADKRRFIGTKTDIIIAVCDEKRYPSSVEAQEVKMARNFGNTVIALNPYISEQNPQAASDFAGILRELRLKEGISQEKLAEKIGYSKYIISKLETQRLEPSIRDLINIAQYFGISVDRLLGVADAHGPAVPLWLSKSYEKLSVQQKKAVKIIIEALSFNLTP